MTNVRCKTRTCDFYTCRNLLAQEVLKFTECDHTSAILKCQIVAGLASSIKLEATDNTRNETYLRAENAEYKNLIIKSKQKEMITIEI